MTYTARTLRFFLFGLAALTADGSLAAEPPLDPAGLHQHLGMPPAASNRAELDQNLLTYREAKDYRALAVFVTSHGELTTTLAVNMRFPAEAAVEALSRCERLRSVTGASGSGPCELVHSGDRWIETTQALKGDLRPEAAAPVWRIDGGKRTLWLGGSVHVLKAPFHPLPAAFETAFTQADRLALELDPTRMGEADRRLAMQGAVMANAEQVKSALGPDRPAKLAPLLVRHGIEPAAVYSLKPAVLATQISVAEMAALGYLPDQGIDLHFARRASVTGKTVLELESVAEQMQALAGSPLDVQAILLDATVEQIDRTPEVINDLLRAWLRADADALYRLMMQDFNGHLALERLGRRILDDRNKVMHTRIRAWLDEPRSTFVIVGAGHLGGPNGLLKLLAADGFAITQLAANGQPLKLPVEQPAGHSAQDLRRTGTE